MGDTINTIIDKKAHEQVLQLEQELKDSHKAFLDFVKDVQGSGLNFKNLKLPSQLQTQLVQTGNATNQLNEYQKESERLNKSLSAAQIKFAQSQSKTNQELIRTRLETQIMNRVNKESAILGSKLTSEYQKQSLILEQLRKKYKDVALTQGMSSKAARTLAKEVQQLDARLKNVDANVGQFQRSVGNYGKAFQSLGGVLRSTAQAFGLMTGAFLAASIIKNAVERVRQFDKAMANLSGILGTSRENLKSLENSIISVAGSSIKTSNEVADLATALITLGKTESEVIRLLKPTNDLSIALQATSEDAGQLLVGTLNAFQKGAEEGEHFANVIAKMRTSSALDFQQIADAMGYIAPAANAAGMSLEKAGAVVGVLADNNIKGQRAGRLMSSSLLRLAKDGMTLEDALLKLNQAQEDGATRLEMLALSAELFDAQAAPLGLILANNTDRLKDFTNELENSNGALKQLTDAQLESLDAKLKILDSTWEEFILNIEDGQGVISNFFKSAIDGASSFLKLLQGINTTGNERLESDGFKSAIQDIEETAKETGRTIQEVAKESSIAFSDEIEKIEERNKLLRDSNAAADKQKGEGGGFFGHDKQYKLNAKALEENNKKLAMYNGLLKGSSSLENVSDEVVDMSGGGGGSTDNYGKSEKELADLRKRLAKDAYDLDESRLKRSVEIEKEITKNKELEIDLRLEGSERLATESLALLELQKNNALSNAEGSRDLITRINEEAANEAVRIEAAKNEQIKEIYADNFKDKLNDFKALQDADEQRLDEEVFNLKKSMLEKGASVEEIEKAIEDLKRESLKKQLEDQIDFAFKELELAATTAEQIAQIEKEKLKLKKQLLDEEFNATKTTSEAIADEGKKLAELKKERSEELKNLALDSVYGIFQAEVQKYDERLSANDRFYGALLENEQLTDEQRGELERQRAGENEKLEKKKAEAAKKAFLMEQGMRIALIAIDTIQKVSAITTTAALLASNPITAAAAPLALAQIPVVIQSGAIAAGTILAQSIPAFEKGKKESDSYEGQMLWGEKRPEVKVDKAGNVEVANKPTIGTTKKGDTIFPSIDAFKNSMSYDQIVKASILTSMQHQGDRLSNADIKNAFDYNLLTSKIDEGIKSGFKNIKINNKTVNNNDSLVKAMQIAARKNV